MATTSIVFEDVPLPSSAPEELAGPPHQLAPVTRAERINGLDVLRGFSLMGILLMNITSFGLPEWAYAIPLGTLLPVFSGPHARANTFAWMLRWVLAEGKMRAMFSMLFGAGVILLTDRGEDRGDAVRTADIFHRRNMWLVLFGMLHAYFIWEGDILFWYGVSALLFLYPLRKLPAKRLFRSAGILLLIWTMVAGFGRFMGTYSTVKKGNAAIAAVHAGKTLTKEERDAIGAKVKQDGNWWHSTQRVEENVKAHHGGYWKAFSADVPSVFDSERAIYFAFPDVLIGMLLGMALFRNGFLTGKMRTRVYVITALAAQAISLSLGTAAAVESWRHGFEIVLTTGWTLIPYDVQRFSGAVGNAAVILLVLRFGALGWLTRRVASVGQMALSNYLLTSLLCKLLFVWAPPHWYGYLEYYKLYFVVAGVWCINLLWSPLWLRHFQFGPMEWVWRSLTYWRAQPMRMGAASEPAAVTTG